MRLQKCAVHHHRIALSPGLRQFLKDLGEDTHPGPASEPVVQGLVGAMDCWRILPPKTVSPDVDDAAQNLAVVGSGAPSDLGKERLNASHLLWAQPEVFLLSVAHGLLICLNRLHNNANL